MRVQSVAAGSIHGAYPNRTNIVSCNSLSGQAPKRQLLPTLVTAAFLVLYSLGYHNSLTKCQIAWVYRVNFKKIGESENYKGKKKVKEELGRKDGNEEDDEELGKNVNTLEVQGHSSVVVATAAAGAAASAKM